MALCHLYVFRGQKQTDMRRPLKPLIPRGKLPRKPLSPATVEEFWSWVDWEDRGPDECWRWTWLYWAVRGTDGTSGKYGMFRGMQAHAIAKYIDDGQRPPPHGHHVMHSCDHPWCCNPRHLSYGTPQDNVNDMLAKGRHRSNGRPGEPRAKLSHETKQDICNSRLPHQTWARKLKVHVQTIIRVRKQGRAALENK